MSVTANVPRPVALCVAERPVCPKCGLVMLGHYESRPEGTYVTCSRENPNPGRQRFCSQKALVLTMSQRLCAVVQLTEQEFEVLRRHDRSAREILEELGLLVKAVIDAERRAS